MIKCPHCGKTVSSRIYQCPYCKKKLRRQSPSKDFGVLRYDEMDAGLVDPKRVNRRRSLYVWISVLAILAFLFLLIILISVGTSAHPYVSACMRHFLSL